MYYVVSEVMFMNYVYKGFNVYHKFLMLQSKMKNYSLELMCKCIF